MANLTLLRIASDKDSTLGVMLFDGKFVCHTIEDQYRPGPVKVRGETRIPEGRYEIILREFGGFHERYKNHLRIGAVHKGMLWIRHVPRFSDVLIHCGNTHEDTAGCVLVGQAPPPFHSHRVDRSVDTYMEIYPTLARYAAQSDLFITIKDCDHA